jgi:hypothetical protein
MKHTQTLQLTPNAVILPTDLQTNLQAENLISLDASGVNFATGFYLANLFLDNCQEISVLLLTGATGLVIPTETAMVASIPKGWAGLTKLSSINFSGCGLSEASVNNLLIGLNKTIGIGSAILTAKVITINGQNARPLLSNTLVSDAKAGLIAKGWTVTHN